MNRPTARATVRQKKTPDAGPRLATAWELADLLQPLPAVARPPRKYRPKELTHFAAVVEFVYQNRFAVRSQVQRRFPKWIRSERTAQYQLARLAELGYLDTASARSTSPNFPFVYFATGKGVTLLREAWAELGIRKVISTREEHRERSRAIDTLMHELMLTEFGLSLHLTAGSRDDLKILTTERRYYRAESVLEYTSPHGRTRQVKPDAGFLVKVERPDSDPAFQLFLTEMDRGGMSLERIRQKYELYDGWANSPAGQSYLTGLYSRFGAKNPQPGFRLLVIAHDGVNPGKDYRRLHDLFAQSLELPISMRDRMWFTTVEQLREHQADAPPLSAPLWYRARDARAWLADYRSFTGQVRRQPELKLRVQQRQFVAGQFPSLPLHPLFPNPVAAVSP